MGWQKPMTSCGEYNRGTIHQDYMRELQFIADQYDLDDYVWCVPNTYRVHSKASKSSSYVGCKGLKDRIDKALAKDPPVRYKSLLLYCAATLRTVNYFLVAVRDDAIEEAEQCYQQCLIDLRKNDE